MFKRKKKKTGCETPKFRQPTPPPPPTESVEENFKPRHFCRNMIGDQEHFDQLAKRHNDLIKMDGAEVYFSVKSGITVIVTTKEWKDYFLGRSDIIPNTKENDK